MFALQSDDAFEEALDLIAGQLLPRAFYVRVLVCEPCDVLRIRGLCPCTNVQFFKKQVAGEASDCPSMWQRRVMQLMSSSVHMHVGL